MSYLYLYFSTISLFISRCIGLEYLYFASAKILYKVIVLFQKCIDKYMDYKRGSFKQFQIQPLCKLEHGKNIDIIIEFSSTLKNIQPGDVFYHTFLISQNIL